VKQTPRRELWKQEDRVKAVFADFLEEKLKKLKNIEYRCGYDDDAHALYEECMRPDLILFSSRNNMA
jgi:hypothetical protein